MKFFFDTVEATDRYGKKTQTQSPKVGRIAAVASLAFFVLVTFFGSYTIVNSGNRGVVRHFGKISNEILDEGIHLKMPFFTDVVEMSVRVQKTEIKTGSSSKDMQQIDTHVVVNWEVDPSKVSRIFQELGGNTGIISNILEPAVSEVFKAASAKKTAEEIISRRIELTDDVNQMLRDRVGKYGINVRDISLVDVQFGSEFNKAVESKQVAEQQAKQAEYDALKATADAKANVNKAKGDAEATLTRARAQAEAQKLLRQSITAEILQQQAIDKWNGEFPQVMGGGTVPFLNIDTKSFKRSKEQAE